MPKISGREIISETTERSQTRLMIAASIAIISKSYGLPVDQIKMLGMDFPPSIFDISLLVVVAWYSYSYFVKWVGDLLSFRMWYSESSIWSQFGTNMKLDKAFISGGIDALKAFNETQMQDEKYKSKPEDQKKLYENFKTNVELYSVRLEYAGKKFKTISIFGHFYVWLQGAIIPGLLAIVAIYLLIKFGSFYAPPHI